MQAFGQKLFSFFPLEIQLFSLSLWYQKERTRDMYKNGIEALERYNNLMGKIDKMAVADALEELKLVAEAMADALTDIIYCE